MKIPSKMKAIWNGKIIAESNDIVNVEGNSYFPNETVKKEYFKNSKTQTVCPWKGTAAYYSLEDDESVDEDAAWHYPEPKEAAVKIKNRVAFGKEVEVIED